MLRQTSVFWNFINLSDPLTFQIARIFPALERERHWKEEVGYFKPMEWFHVFVAVAADANQHFWEKRFALEVRVWVQSEKGFLQSTTRPTLAHYYMNYWVPAITNSQSKGKTRVVLPEDITSMGKRWKGEVSAAGMKHSAFSVLGKEGRSRNSLLELLELQEAQRWHKRQMRDSPGFSWWAEMDKLLGMWGTSSYSSMEVELYVVLHPLKPWNDLHPPPVVPWIRNSAARAKAIINYRSIKTGNTSLTPT